jgi:hypothetical protein
VSAEAKISRVQYRYGKSEVNLSLSMPRTYMGGVNI